MTRMNMGTAQYKYGTGNRQLCLVEPTVEPTVQVRCTSRTSTSTIKTPLCLYTEYSSISNTKYSYSYLEYQLFNNNTELLFIANLNSTHKQFNNNFYYLTYWYSNTYNE